MEVEKIFIVQRENNIEQLYLLKDGRYVLNKTFFVSTGTYMSILTYISNEQAEKLKNNIINFDE